MRVPGDIRIFRFKTSRVKIQPVWTSTHPLMAGLGSWLGEIWLLVVIPWVATPRAVGPIACTLILFDPSLNVWFAETLLLRSSLHHPVALVVRLQGLQIC